MRECENSDKTIINYVFINNLYTYDIEKCLCLFTERFNKFTYPTIYTT